MKDQQSTSNDNQEPKRNKTVPDDFIWDPELQAWYPPGEPSNWDAEAWQRNFDKICAELANEPPTPPEMLRLPASVLDVPPSWRKSLSAGCGERDLFSDLADQDEKPEQEPIGTSKRPRTT